MGVTFSLGLDYLTWMDEVSSLSLAGGNEFHGRGEA